MLQWTQTESQETLVDFRLLINGDSCDYWNMLVSEILPFEI